MKKPSSACFIFVSVSCLLISSARAQGRPDFDISVPNISTPGSPLGPTPIVHVRATVSVASSSAITFKITAPGAAVLTMPSLTPGAGATALTVFPQTGCAGIACDAVQITPSQSAATEPDHNRYVIDIYTRTNYQLNCTNTQGGAADNFNVTVLSPGPNVTGVCVQSFGGHTNPLNCGLETVKLPTDVVATVVQATGPAPTILGCENQRPPVDVALVLDRSGSMADSVTGTPPASADQAKIHDLRSAVKTLATVWNSHAVSGDSIGAALFDDSFAWWQQGTFTGTGLHTPIGSVFTPITDEIDVCQTNPTSSACTLQPRGSTSIGGGLLFADNVLTNANNRHVMLLVSDGMQNTDPKVRGDMVAMYCDEPQNTTLPPANPLCLSPDGTGRLCTSSSPCPLLHRAQVYAVTVGKTGGNNEAVNQGIATQSGGFYINAETNSTLLSPYFLELLQNFLKFNSYDTARLVSRVTPYSTNIAVPTTSTEVQFNLMWPSRLGPLRMTVTPPGAPAIVKDDASGLLSITQSLPLSVPFDPVGDWKVEVTAIGPNHEPVEASAAAIPFDLHVMTDDEGVKSNLSAVASDYKTGDDIRLRAKLNYFAQPILGLDSHTGARVMADLIKPEQSVGDMLSDSTASATPSCVSTPTQQCDPQSGAEAKLANALQSAPLKQTHEPDIPLFDDGKPEHGDDAAGDGIYSAVYPAILPGNYHFLISAESTDPNSVRFSRQQLRTVVVRPVPDAGNTVFQTSILRRDRGSILSILMTPRFRPGPGCVRTDPKCGRMGPGWANYFWFTTPGKTPFKAIDNLNGTYTATLAFTGSNPPPVSVHFENVLAVIGDSVTPDHLPAPLGPDNVFTDVPPPGGTGKFAVFLDAGTGIPHGTFGNFFNTGFSLNTGLEYIATSHFSLEGIFGYHRFPAKIADDLNLYQFSVNGKAYLTNGTLRPFVNGGVSAYKFSPGPTKFGGNIGGGVLYSLTSRVGLEGTYNFHVINTPGAATKFSSLQGGIRFVF
jgi:hypothetical protein